MPYEGQAYINSGWALALTDVPKHQTTANTTCLASDRGTSSTFSWLKWCIPILGNEQENNPSVKPKLLKTYLIRVQCHTQTQLSHSIFFQQFQVRTQSETESFCHIFSQSAVISWVTQTTVLLIIFQKKHLNGRVNTRYETWHF